MEQRVHDHYGNATARAGFYVFRNLLYNGEWVTAVVPEKMEAVDFLLHYFGPRVPGAFNFVLQFVGLHVPGSKGVLGHSMLRFQFYDSFPALVVNSAGEAREVFDFIVSAEAARPVGAPYSLGGGLRVMGTDYRLVTSFYALEDIIEMRLKTTDHDIMKYRLPQDQIIRGRDLEAALRKAWIDAYGKRYHLVTFGETI